MAIKLADTLAPMADFPAALAEHVEFSDGKSLQEKYDLGELGGEGGGGHIELTQAEYDALTDEEKLNGAIYFITDAPGGGGDDSSYVELSQVEYDVLTDDEKMNGREYRTYDTGHIYKLGIEYGKDTKLSQYGLVSNAQNFKIDITKNNPYWYGFFTFSFMYGTTPCEITVSIVNDVSYIITKGQNLVSAITYTQDGANYTIGIDLTTTVYGTQVVEMPIEFGIVNSFTDEQFTGDTTTIFKGYESRIYTSLSQLGLDTTATINDIIGAMANGSQITYKTDVFDYAIEYNNIQYGTVTIHKQSDGRVQVFMTDKDTGNLYVGKMDNTNKVIGWRNESFHRIVTQGTAGYFKFKPTSNGMDQPLRISVTDNYGGMINISGATPSNAQYKPFKCIRLSNGTYADYDAIKTTNNKMEKLYFYDGYFYLKVVSYTTCTFTGLIEAPTYVETFDDTDAEQIPIRSVFDTPYNNGYANPSIICIGDTDSSDGVVKTLATLGFTGDMMTWDNGEYRVSHVGGLTNLPAEITEEKPGFRLEHHDVKKWGNNHNPHKSTYGCRQSVLHYKGSIFVRYQESGATAGVLITDTGWQKAGKENTRELVTNAQNFKLDITKKNASFYGFIKLEYLYGYHLCEICIGISSAVAYTVTKGKNLIDKITYTVDGANIIFGIDFTSKVYGVQVVEMPTNFGTINGLTAESFAGSTVANQTGLDLELHPQTKVVTSLNKGTWQVGQRIKQKTDFTATTDDVAFEFVAKNESSTSTGKYQKMTIYQLTPIENGTNASTSYSVFEDGKAQVTLWPATQDMPRNDYNIVCEGYLKEYVDEYVDVSVAKKQNVYSTSETIAGTWVDGKTLYRKTIKYTFSSSSSSSSSSLEIATISGLTHLISATGVYQRTGYTDFAIPYSKDSNNHIYVTCNPANKKIFINAASYNSGDVAYVTVEYIK